MAQIPWKRDNDQLSVLLLESVLTTGAHLHAGTTKATALWIVINNDFFDNDLLQPYKHNKGEPRKLQNHVNEVKKKVNEVINEGGNRSQLKGDWSELYKKVRQIDEEVEEQRESEDAKKERDLANRKTIQDAETGVLNKGGGSKSNNKPVEGYGKRRNLDGTFIDPPAKSTRTQQTFEGILFQSLAEEDVTKERPERRVEREMLEWMMKMHKHTYDVYDGDNCAVLDLLEEVTLEVLVNLYCAPGKKFAPDNFKTQMREMEFPFLAVHKIFKTLEEWREASTPAPLDAFITPPTMSAAAAVAAEDAAASDEELDRFASREYGGPPPKEDSDSEEDTPAPAPAPAPAPVAVAQRRAPVSAPVAAPAPAKKTSVRGQAAVLAAAASWRSTGVMSTKDV
ncbi:hypothetical protein B484DRAFT_405118 [Ochromonadaceae sp. CCMP2298]|nr:hypothetical protein B484DRAFT_405118 [Ochromonadaceae sp. CCMP2298]